MKRIFLFALFWVANCFAAHVAVLETIRTDEVLDSRECHFLTDKLRQMAVRSLPSRDGWTIMTRENINEMLPPGKSVEDCEGSCLVETGKNISADYIAQGWVSHFGSLVTMTVELYETASGKLMSSFAVQSENAEGLLKEVEKHAESLFQTVSVSQRENAESARQENHLEKVKITDKEIPAGETAGASLDTMAETAEKDYSVLHSLNFVFSIEAEAEHGAGDYMGPELNWSRYMIEKSGFSSVCGVTIGYVSGENGVEVEHLGVAQFEGVDFNFKYGLGYAFLGGKSFLAFYGLAGAEFKFLDDTDQGSVYAGDRIAFDMTMGTEVTFGYRLGGRLWLLGGVEVTTDVVGYASYEVADSGGVLLFPGVNIEPHVGVAFAF